MVGDSKRLNEFFFDPLVRTYVLDIVTQFPQSGNQCNIGGDMPGSSAAGEYDSFHNEKPPDLKCVSVQKHEETRRKPAKITFGDGTCYRMFNVFTRTMQ